MIRLLRSGEREQELGNDAIVAEGLSKAYHDLAERVFEAPTPLLTRAFRGRRPSGIDEEVEEEDDDDEGLDEEEPEQVEVVEEEREAAVWALRDVSFRIPRGETVGLVGGAGSGKTTLLRILSGALPPTAGYAVLAGRPSPPINLAVQLMVPTYGPDANAAVAAALVGSNRRQLRPHLDRILELADAGRADVKAGVTRVPYKVAVAVAVELGSDVLLLDDPFASASGEYRERVLEAIERRQAEGATILLETRDREAMRRLCRRALWLDDGKVVRLGQVDEILAAYDAAAVAGKAAGPAAGATAGFNETAAIVSARAEATAPDRVDAELRLEVARAAVSVQPAIGLAGAGGTGLWFEQPDPVVCELPGFHRFRLAAQGVPPGRYAGVVQARVLEGGNESPILRRGAFALVVGAAAGTAAAPVATVWEPRDGSWLYEPEQA